MSRCIQEIGQDIRNGERDVFLPCRNIREFEIWRISFIDRLTGDEYDENEPLEVPYKDLAPEGRDYVDKIKN